MVDVSVMVTGVVRVHVRMRVLVDVMDVRVREVGVLMAVRVQVMVRAMVVWAMVRVRVDVRVVMVWLRVLRARGDRCRV